MPRATFQIKQYKQVKIAAMLSFAVILLSGVYFLQPFSPDNSYAEDHEDTANGTYNGTNYSLTTTVSDLNLELKNVTPAGKAVYGKQTVNVTTTAPGGYQLYMQTSGNLSGTKDGTATSDSIAALSANNSALDTNSWGYVTASALSSASTTLDEDMDKAATQEVWNTPPSTLTQIDATSSAAASGRDTDIYYGIKADNTLSGDNYSGTITYTTIANDAASDTLLSVSPTSGTAGTATTLTIITSLMTTIDGLSASDISATVGGYTCGSISISSRAPLTFTCNTSTSLTSTGTQTITVKVNKYNKTYTKTSAYTVTEDNTMQNFTTAKCDTLTQWTSNGTQGSTATLKDSRNSRTYSIRRLADGNCWMVTNLAITNKTITSNDSDVDNDFIIPATNSDADWGDDINAAYMHVGSSSDDGDNDWKSGYGPYYNWYTATAGTGIYSIISGSVNSSICPRGWKLPFGDSASYSWYKIYINSSSNVTRFQTATNTGSRYWGGYYFGGSLRNAGVNGYWWSRTADNAGYAHSLSTLNGYVYPQSNNSKTVGLAIRCVFVGS